MNSSNLADIHWIYILFAKEACHVIHIGIAVLLREDALYYTGKTATMNTADTATLLT